MEMTTAAPLFPCECDGGSGRRSCGRAAAARSRGTSVTAPSVLHWFIRRPAFLRTISAWTDAAIVARNGWREGLFARRVK